MAIDIPSRPPTRRFPRFYSKTRTEPNPNRIIRSLQRQKNQNLSYNLPRMTGDGHLLLPPSAPRRRPVVVHEVVVLPAARKQVLLAPVAARRLRRVPHRRLRAALLVVRPVEVEPVEHAR